MPAFRPAGAPARARARALLVDRHRLVDPHLDLAAVDHERRDLVVEPGAVAGHAPADAGVAHAGEPRQRARDQPRSRRDIPIRIDVPLVLRQRVAIGRADRLPDAALHAGAAREGHLAEVGVVHVAGQGDDRGRGLAALARADRRGTAPPAARTTPGTPPSAPGRPSGAASRPRGRPPAPRRRRPPPRSRPRGSACRGRAATAARWRSAGGRSRRWRARRPSPTPRRRASSACPPRARARRASRSTIRRVSPRSRQ